MYGILTNKLLIGIRIWKMKFWIFILLGIFSKSFCDSFQRKLTINNQPADISTDWKPLSIRDLKPPPAVALHPGFVSLSNPLNRNKFQIAAQLAHHNPHLLRQYHPIVASPSQWNHFPAAIYAASHLPINMPSRFNGNLMNIQTNPSSIVHPLSQHNFPIDGTAPVTNIMKTPISKSLIKPESFGVVKTSPQLQHQPSVPKAMMFNGLHTTTPKIPTPHHIRSPQFFKSFNNYPIGDTLVFGGFSSTSPKAPILAHQNVIGHTIIPNFKKFPVTNPPTGLGIGNPHHHLLPSSYISYSYPLTAGKTTNHFQLFQVPPPAVTTVRTPLSPVPENVIQKQRYHLKPHENSINLKVEAHMNSVQGPSSEAPFKPVHHHQHHRHQNQNQNGNENIKILPNSEPQFLPPVPASVLTPFFVPSIQDQDLSLPNKTVDNSSKEEVKKPDSTVLTQNDYPDQNSFNKDVLLTTTVKTLENVDDSKIHDISYNVASVTTPSSSLRVNQVNENFNGAYSTRRPTNNYHEQSNYVHAPSPPAPPFKLEKFSSVFSNPKSTSVSFLPTPQNVQNSFFTLEDAITMHPFKEYEHFDEINKIPKTSTKEKPSINLNFSTQSSSMNIMKSQQNKINQPRYRLKPKVELQTPSTTVQTFSREPNKQYHYDQTERRPNNVNPLKNSNKIELSTEKPAVTISQNEDKYSLRKKSNYKNSLRYHMRRNNTMNDIRMAPTATSSTRQNIVRFPSSSSSSPSSSSSISTSTTSSTSNMFNNNRITVPSMINKISLTRNPSLLLRPILSSQIPHQTTADELDFTQTSTTAVSTTSGTSGVPTTTLDLQEFPTPTANNAKSTEQQHISTHNPTILSTVFQSPSSSSLPDTTKRIRQRVKYRKQDNGENKNVSSESPPLEDLKSSTSSSSLLDSSKDTPDPNKKMNLPERPRFSIRNYRRPLKNTTISSSSTLSTPTTIITTTTTTTTTELPTEISSSTERNRGVVTRKRLLPTLQFRHYNTTTESNRQGNRSSERRGSNSENSNSKNDQNKSGENNDGNNKVKPTTTRRRGSNNRRIPSTNRNGNLVTDKQQTSKEIDSSSNIIIPSSAPAKEGVPNIKNTNSLRRPPKLSLKERIQNHLSRKSNNSDDLLNITLETKSSNVESTTPSSSTVRIESAIMKIAKEDSHSHQKGMNSNSVTSSVIPSRKNSISLSSVTSSVSSSVSSPSSSLPSSSSSLNADDQSMSDNISRYVDELTASSSSNSLNVLNRGIHTRRIPNYFTIATEDPILPIEAFFPNVLKDNINNNNINS